MMELNFTEWGYLPASDKPRASIHVVDVWIDGSFISRIDEPNDGDIIVFLVESELRAHRLTLTYTDSQLEELDTKWVPSFDKSTSLSRAVDELEQMRWFMLFGSDGDDRPKRIISLKSFFRGSDN